MKKCSIIAIVLLCGVMLNAQKTKEFEGKISYSHTVTAITPGYNIQSDYDYMGKQSVFYYKTGKYKWVNENAYIMMELFNNKLMKSYLQFAQQDTILALNSNEENEKVIDYKILKNADTVLGHKCDVLVIKAGSNGHEWERRYSFDSSTTIDPESFSNYSFNSTKTIYSLLKALPLKIELIFKDRKVTYTATKVEKTAVKDSLFEFAAGTKFKNGM